MCNENGGEGSDAVSETGTPHPNLTRGHWCAGEYGKAARLPVYPFISEAIAFCKVEGILPLLGALTVPVLILPSSLNFPVPLGGRKQSSSSQNQNQISFLSRSTISTPGTFPWEGTDSGKAEVHFLQVDDRADPPAM